MSDAVTQSPERRALPMPADYLEYLDHGREKPLGRLGSLTVRLALTENEVRVAQELRHRVFFADIHVNGGRDEDSFDEYCDHLLVLDRAIHPDEENQIVGACRLLRQDRAIQAGRFYSQSEFDVASLVSRHPHLNFLELGRSCVQPDYRSKRTAELLWQGIWAYCRLHEVDAMFGCASFPGTTPMRHALPLSFLNHHARAAGGWEVKPVSNLAVLADLVPAEGVNPKQALFAMPPLVKGYLRLGAKFSGHAVIDPEFGTTDVLVTLRTEDISARYLNHFGHEAERFA